MCYYLLKTEKDIKIILLYYIIIFLLRFWHSDDFNCNAVTHSDTSWYKEISILIRVGILTTVAMFTERIREKHKFASYWYSRCYFDYTTPYPLRFALFFRSHIAREMLTYCLCAVFTSKATIYHYGRHRAILRHSGNVAPAFTVRFFVLLKHKR